MELNARVRDHDCAAQHVPERDDKTQTRECRDPSII